MRLWTLHPHYLDPAGLVALWREALLAQAVLGGHTIGYQQHPQLIRFRAHPHPLAAIASYLETVHEESRARRYHFDRSKVGRHTTCARITETEGQLWYEWEHLQRKLQRRSPQRYQDLIKVARPLAHPLFCIVPGEVRVWEKRA